MSTGLFVHFPLLLAAAPLKLILVKLSRTLPAGSFSAAFSGGPIEAGRSVVFSIEISPEFSAAFSGGPIEASRSEVLHYSRPNFPLLLAAAPLKLTLPAQSQHAYGDFPLLLAAAPLKPVHFRGSCRWL